jgi:transcriptional regulator GlxA family with amidase domain
MNKSRFWGARDMALKCGFTHMGRFSQLYHRHFFTAKGQG